MNPAAPGAPAGEAAEEPFTNRQLLYLCGRNRIYTAMMSFQTQAAIAACTEEFDASLTKTLKLIKNTEPNAGEAHGAYLARVAAGVAIQPTDPPCLRAALRSADAALRAEKETPCTAAGAVCLADPAAPRCLDNLVLRHFRAVMNEVTDNYRRYCSRPGELPTPQVSLTVSHLGTDNTFGRVRWIGGGARPLETDPARPASAVSLALNVEEADFKSVRAVPYALFHECACHAFSGLRPGTRRRPQTESADPFAEGWMDFLASELCARVADGLGLSTANGGWELTAEHAEAGKQLSGARADFEDQKLTDSMRRERGERKHGGDAAFAFLRWLRRTYKDSERAWDTFMHISLDWNVLREREQIARRRQFVSYISDCLNTKNTNALQPAIEKYLVDRLTLEAVTALLPA